MDFLRFTRDPVAIILAATFSAGAGVKPEFLPGRSAGSFVAQHT
jgi:hypothetical protein